MGNSTSSIHNVADDISKKLGDLRSKALKNLHEMLSTYGKPIPTVRDDELDAFKLQVENRMLLVAFVGEGSSGKSTLINAILRDEFLPYGCERTTNLRIYIKHNPSIKHGGDCQKGPRCELCPKLCENLGGKSGKQKKICAGVDAIRKQISSRNKEAVNSKVTVVLVIEANVEMFEGLALLPNAQDYTVYIVDSPGMECLREDTMEFFSITSQMIYILNYSRFLQDREKVVNELREKPSSAQLLFAVTYFDVYYTPGTGENNPDEKKVKQLVSEAFNDVKEDEVFPVCGKWVLNAYLLKKQPYDSNRQVVVRRAYEDYKQQTEGSSSGREPDHSINTILKIGGVQALENRIRWLVGTTDLYDLNRVICNQAEILLQKPIKAAKDLQEEIERDFKALKKWVDAHRRKDRKITQALDHIHNSCDEGFVTRETKDKFNIEDFLSKTETELLSTLNIFKDQCYRNVRDSVYTIESFENEFKTFKEETIPNKIKEVYQNQFMTFFYSWTEVLKAELKDVVSLLEEDISITDYSNAELICPTNTRLRFFDPLRTKRESVRSQRFYHIAKCVASAVLGASLSVGAAPVAIVGVPLGLGICIYQGYRAWNTDEKKAPLSQADLEEILEQTMKDIKSAHNIDLIREYLESGKTLFCQQRCKDIVEEAQKLWDKYQENWKEYREEFTRKLTENIDKLQRITAEKSKLEAALDELKKADAFLKDIKEIVPITIEETD